MSVIVLYLAAKGLVFGLSVYCTYDAIMVATSKAVDDVGRRGMTWRLSGLLWGMWIAWSTVEDRLLSILLSIP